MKDSGDDGSGGVSDGMCVNLNKWKVEARRKKNEKKQIADPPQLTKKKKREQSSFFLA